jgi:hypothetical protein
LAVRFAPNGIVGVIETIARKLGVRTDA